MNANIPTFWWHVAQVIIGVCVLGAVTFQIVRPTNTQKTVVQDGGKQIEYWKDSEVKPGFGGCVTIKSENTPT